MQRVEATRRYKKHSPDLLDNGYTVLPVADGYKVPSVSASYISPQEIEQDRFYAQRAIQHRGSVSAGDTAAKFIPDWSEFTLDSVLSGEEGSAYWGSHQHTGICVLTGPMQGNLFCIDVDFPDDNTSKKVAAAIDALIPDEIAVRRKGSKGFAQFFVVDPSSEFRIPPSLDVEGHGGVDLLFAGKQSVLPPSVHPSGKRYEYITERTLEDTHIDDLPVVDGELYDQIIDIFRSLGEVTEGKGNARFSTAGSGEYRNPFDKFILQQSLKDPSWLDELGLARVERISDDLIVAIPTFRESSTGRPVCERKQQLHITNKVIIDRTNGQIYSVDRLIAKCLGLSLDEAWAWLYEVAPAARPTWEPKHGKRNKSVVKEPEPSPPTEVEEYNPDLEAYLAESGYYDDPADDVITLESAAKIPTETITYDEAAAEVEAKVEIGLERSKANKLWRKAVSVQELAYTVAIQANDQAAADNAAAEAKRLAANAPRGVVIKAQTGVGKSRAVKKHFFDLETALGSTTNAMLSPTIALGDEQLEGLNPVAREKTGGYHPADQFREDGTRWCQHPSLDSAIKLGIPVERLCESGGGDGNRCPHYDNCPFRENNKFLKKSDTHMMSSHATALSRCSNRTGEFDTLVFDEEILSAAIQEPKRIKSHNLSARRLVGLFDQVSDEYIDSVNLDDVLSDIMVAISESGKTSDDSGSIPLDVSLISETESNIGKAKGFLLNQRFEMQKKAFDCDFLGDFVSKIANKINMLDKIITLFDELLRAIDAGVTLSGRILIDPENGDIQVLGMGGVDAGLLQRGFPILLDATPPDLDLYAGMFDFQIKLDGGKGKHHKDIYIPVKREFDILSHTPVAHADSLKVVQVVGSPSSVTKLGLSDVKKALVKDTYNEPSNGKDNRKNVKSAINLITGEAQGDWMIICNKTYMSWCEATGDPLEGFLSFGSLAGTNSHEQDKVGVIVGHPRLAPDDLYQQVGQITGSYCSDRESSKVKRSIQLADGSVEHMDGYKLEDDTAERLANWQAQKSFVQGVGRLRPLTNKGFEQTVVIMTNEDTGLLIDEQIHWDDLRDQARNVADQQELTELAKNTPISSNWRFCESVGVPQPAVIARKIQDLLLVEDRNGDSDQFVCLPLIGFTKDLPDKLVGVSNQVQHVDGGNIFDVYFHSEQALIDYLSEYDLPYTVIRNQVLIWDQAAVALRVSNIIELEGVSRRKAQELSRNRAEAIKQGDHSHELIEYKLIVDGKAESGPHRKAAVRKGGDPVEAIQSELRVDAVVLRG